MLNFIKKNIWKIIKWLRVFIIYRLLNRTTYGVRILLVDENKVFLIKHPYDNFWVLPGGGQKKNEDIFCTAKREILEEGQIEISGDLKKLGQYFNTEVYKKDYISIVVAEEWKNSNESKRIIDKIEVQKTNWFSFDDLPIVSIATKERIKEYLNNDYSDELRDWS
jgi:8-oxo-dGTP pyrophosphatase MutT (NUDIX family)